MKGGGGVGWGAGPKTTQGRGVSPVDESVSHWPSLVGGSVWCHEG